MRAVLLCVVLSACATEDGPLFPASYASSFSAVRECRPSADHDLHKIRVFADRAAAAAYTSRTSPFPVGAVLVKEEYDFTDDACAEPILNWTVMQKIDGDANGGWRWQRVDADRNIVSEDDSRCIGCHAACVEPDGGYLGTCAVP